MTGRTFRFNRKFVPPEDEPDIMPKIKWEDFWRRQHEEYGLEPYAIIQLYTKKHSSMTTERLLEILSNSDSIGNLVMRFKEYLQHDAGSQDLNDLIKTAWRRNGTGRLFPFFPEWLNRLLAQIDRLTEEAYRGHLQAIEKPSAETTAEVWVALKAATEQKELDALADSLRPDPGPLRQALHDYVAQATRHELAQKWAREYSRKSRKRRLTNGSDDDPFEGL